LGLDPDATFPFRGQGHAFNGFEIEAQDVSLNFLDLIFETLRALHQLRFKDLYNMVKVVIWTTSH
jgi:hypothetical protein